MAHLQIVRRHLLPRTASSRHFFSSTSLRSLSSGGCYSIGNSTTVPPHHRPLHPHHRVHLLFGANTDVGKSIVSTGLVRAAAAASTTPGHHSQDGNNTASSSVNYIKPLQCGGSDELFVGKGVHHYSNINCQTLYRWETPASPHLVSRWENLPVSDEEVLASLQSSLNTIEKESDHNSDNMKKASMMTSTIIETAGGVLSPSSSSPLNNKKVSTEDINFWGWSTQADLYAPLNIPVVFVGDGKLGGISVTLASLEALWSRGYRVDAIVFIDGAGSGGNDDGDGSAGIQFGKGNTEALQEYMTMQEKKQLHNKEEDVQRKTSSLTDQDAIICLPSLPPMPIPLDDWYDNNQEAFLNLHNLLCQRWRNDFVE